MFLVCQKNYTIFETKKENIMPRVFKPVDISKEEKAARKDYFDRHTPFVICDNNVKRGEKLKVKVRLGEEYLHPDDPDHFISYIQLWNRETFLAEAHFTPGTMGNQSAHIEVDFYIVPNVSMNLTAMATCTKHGLWQSDPVEVKVMD
jgi:superoxide reductase